MTISVDWGTKVIYVFKEDMTLVQSTPSEIYSLDLNFFRLKLKDLEDNEDGMMFEDTHRHTPPLDVGGVTLARAVEIINNYTVTFEDGQYAVNLLGANSNVGDRVNVNNVSVRSANSAGLVTSAAIEYGEYGGAVTIDPVNGEAGSVYPIGTLRRPCSNTPDGMVIADARGFNTIIYLRDITLGVGDNIQNMIIHGVNPILTTITINTEAVTDNCSFKHATIQGILDNNTIVEKSIIRDLLYYNGEMRNCTIQGTIVVDGGANAHIVDCVAGVPGDNPPIIDLGGSGQGLSVRNYNGELTIRNKSGTDACSINMNAGHLIIDSTVTAGDIYIEGTAKITNNSTGTAIVHMDSVQVAESAYNELVFVDPIAGESGQVYPFGINTRPVSNISDAFIIADTYNLNGFSIHGSLSINNSLDGLTIAGRGVVSGNILNMNNVSLVGTYLNRLLITGSVSGSTTFYEDCIINNLSGASGIMISCVLGGTIYISGVLQSRATVLSGSPTIIDFSDDQSSILQADIGAGALRIDNMGPSSIAYVKLDSGTIEIGSNCTGGTVRVSGGASIIDNSGVVTIVDSTINTDMTNRIWNEQRENHLEEGSFGAVEEWSGTGTAEIVPEEVASAVWNARTSDYVLGTSFGGRINSIYTNTDIIKNIEAGRWRIANNQMIFYNENGTSELMRFNLYDLSGRPTNTNVMERIPV